MIAAPADTLSPADALSPEEPPVFKSTWLNTPSVATLAAPAARPLINVLLEIWFLDITCSSL
jgi:hypothetical protein